MSCGASELAQLPIVDDDALRLEGVIWVPASQRALWPEQRTVKAQRAWRPPRSLPRDHGTVRRSPRFVVVLAMASLVGITSTVLVAPVSAGAGRWLNRLAADLRRGTGAPSHRRLGTAVRHDDGQGRDPDRLRRAVRRAVVGHQQRRQHRPGVTKDTITVALYQAQPDDLQQSFFERSGSDESLAEETVTTNSTSTSSPRTTSSTAAR